MRKDVGQLLCRELTAPLGGILEVTRSIMKESGTVPAEKVLVNARQINESIFRLDQLAKSLT